MTKLTDAIIELARSREQKWRISFRTLFFELSVNLRSRAFVSRTLV